MQKIQKIQFNRNSNKYLFKSLFFVGIIMVVLSFVGQVSAQEETDSKYLKLEREIINQLNQERVSHNLKELEFSAELKKAASKKAADIIEQDYFLHTSPDGVKAWDLLEAIGYDYKFAGENLAMKFKTAEGVHAAWMKSKTHRENMLFEEYTEIAVVVDEKNDGKLIAVEFFAKPMNKMVKGIIGGTMLSREELIENTFGSSSANGMKDASTKMIVQDKKMDSNYMAGTNLSSDQFMSLNNMVLLVVGTVCLILVVNIWVLEKEDERVIARIKETCSV